MPLSPCVICKAPSNGGHCELHPNTARRQRSTSAWTRASRQAIAAHVARHGWRCLGDDHHEAHDTRDLTADHEHALALGGDLTGVLTVRCRSSNSARGAGNPDS